MDYTKIIVTIITRLAAIVEAFVIPWIKSKVDNNKLNKFMVYVKLAVEAAEQIYGDIEGHKKKQFVIDYLKSQNIHFDEATIDNAIEAAVIEMRNQLLKDYYEEEVAE